MQPTPHLSGLDFARALMRAGLRLTGNAGGYLLLERGERAVTVPIVDDLDPALLRFLMLAAGVSMPQLLDALQPPHASSARESSLPPPPALRVSLH